MTNALFRVFLVATTAQSVRRTIGLGATGLICVTGLVQATQAATDAALAAGRQVKVEGRARADGSFDAVHVVLRDVDHTSKVEGHVTAVWADRRGFSLLGFDVSLTSSTTIYRGTRLGASRAELVPGAWLEVKGSATGRSLVAERVRIKETPEATEELEGLIQSVDSPSGSLTLLGLKVWIPEALPVVDERRGDEAPIDSRLRRDVDDQSREPWRLGSRVLVGGRLDNSWTQTRNYHLAPDVDRTDQWASRLQIVGSAQVSRSIEAYGKVAVNGSALVQNSQRVSSRDVRVQEAYVMAHRVGGGPISVQLGRQRFRDTREWFFDEYMDAVRVLASHGGWSADAAIADGVLAGDIAGRSRRDKRHWLGSVTRQLGSTARASAFVVQRKDTGPADDVPLWLGGSFDAKRESGSRVWAIGAVRRGHRQASALRGWAVDGGGTLLFADVTGTPSLTVGYARASGDAVSGDARDTTFRQTDLEDNSARMGGLRRLAYYGELFDPELSNLQVWTIGAGLRPRRAIGADLVLHRYQQSVTRSSLPSSAFDLDATGSNGRLGHEVDGSVTIRLGRVDIDVAAGAFLAGPGLGRGRRLALFWRPYFRLYF